MDSKTSSDIKDIVAAIRKLIRAVHNESFKISRQFGLSEAQAAVLRCLVVSGPMSSAELGRRLHVTPSNITGVIDRLEKKELVKRTPKQRDRRVCLITLTDKGAELSRNLPDPIETKIISKLADMNEGQILLLRQSIIQILEIIDAREIKENPGINDTITHQ